MASRSIPAIVFRLLVPAVLVGSGACLGIYAYRSTGQDFAAGLAGHRGLLERAAAAEAERLAQPIAAAAAQLEADLDEALSLHSAGASHRLDDGQAPPGSLALIAWCNANGDIRYTRTNAGVSAHDREDGLDEGHYYRLSTRGGEDYEFARRDPARALDAYSFYLPRIRDPARRARLQFACARVSAKHGPASLAQDLVVELCRVSPALTTENGTSVPVAAVLLDAEYSLERLAPAERLRLLEQAAPHLSTDRLAALLEADAFARADDGGAESSATTALAAQVVARRRFEHVLREHGPLLARSTLCYSDAWLLMSRVAAQLDDGRTPDVAVAARMLDLAPRGSNEFRFAIASESVLPDAARAAIAGVRAGDPPVAYVTCSDPRGESYRAELASRRDTMRFLVLLLLGTLAVSAAALFVTVRRLERLALFRQRLIANVSHELKTPATSLRIFAELIEESPGDATKIRRFAELMKSECIRLGGLVEQCLVYSRRGREADSEPSRAVDVGPLLARLTETFAPQAERAGVDFRHEIVPLIALADLSAVERIVMNLLDNAIKYRCGEHPRATLLARRAGERIEIEIADNGPGIAAGEEEKIFEEFYRARFDDYGVAGSGLGLSIARRLARQMGGDIRVESRAGAGSRFTLVLPAPEASTPAAANVEVSARPAEPSESGSART